MRFKASIDEERFYILLTVVQSLEKVGETCAVLLGPEEIVFCAQEDSGVENLHLYAELTQVRTRFIALSILYDFDHAG
jgi:hypothetical protein